ncbi:hypothetical protein PG995_006009 [Apiospora arundinis]|uniref:Uncharacterized protein n=1 Tax=Apiospora arundinis TaxID=335852 RepID=A0ABR2IB44_9PEZI
MEDKKAVEGKSEMRRAVPRFKNHIDIFLPEHTGSDRTGPYTTRPGNDGSKTVMERTEFAARVDISRLGLGYNLNRIIVRKHLYVIV